LNNVDEYIATLEVEFKSNANPEIAKNQQAYMKDNFVFIGMKTDTRREVQKPFLVKSYLPTKMDAIEIVKQLWQKPERDFQLFGQELLFKYVKKLEKTDIEVIAYIIANKSWWDTVDFIAVKLAGAYFKMYPTEREKVINSWLNSGNMWLKRSAILFQLKYKTEVDKEFLAYILKENFGSKEFFINKAIGWVLREYTRTNPEWVIDFVERHFDELSNLSRREALRLLK
jgi:3-methyladenine DNA glycosylase AlkD